MYHLTELGDISLCQEGCRYSEWDHFDTIENAQEVKTLRKVLQYNSYSMIENDDVWIRCKSKRIDSDGDEFLRLLQSRLPFALFKRVLHKGELERVGSETRRLFTSYRKHSDTARFEAINLIPEALYHEVAPHPFLVKPVSIRITPNCRITSHATEFYIPTGKPIVRQSNFLRVVAKRILEVNEFTRKEVEFQYGNLASVRKWSREAGLVTRLGFPDDRMGVSSEAFYVEALAAFMYPEVKGQSFFYSFDPQLDARLECWKWIAGIWLSLDTQF